MLEKLIAHINRTVAGRFAVTLSTVCAVLLFAGATAAAEETFTFSFGSKGGGAGQVNEPAGLAVNQTTGNVYVADRQNHRISEFSGAGEFVQAWGFDVVSSGEDNQPFANEVEDLTIRANGGTFILEFYGEKTEPIAYNAATTTVEEELNSLEIVEEYGGEFSVSGGPGDPNGTSPYTVTFEGGVFDGFDVEPLTVDTTQLSRSEGTELECTGTAYYAQVDGFLKYQWLANGQPISGATSPTYTTAAGDAGKAIQCEVIATFTQFTNPSPSTFATNRAYTLAGSVPSPGPPVGPSSIATPSGPTIPVGGGGGQTLTCNAGSWTGGPTSYTYQWYLRSEPLGPPTTTAATSNEVTLTEGDVSSPAEIQCRVTATNAGGSSTMWSKLKETSPPPPQAGVNDITQPVSTVTEPDGVVPVTTKVNGGPVFEICKANPPSNDVCKKGENGSSLGQFAYPRGVAVDNSPSGAGAVYVGDDFNYRVQKFTASGTPTFEFGGQVDKTTGASLCSAASGDACGAGFKNLDERPGFFGGWPGINPSGSSNDNAFRELGNTVAVDATNGDVFVTDPYDDNRNPFEGRVQKFDKTAQFLGQARPPKFSSEPKPVSVAVGMERNVFVATSGEQTAVNVFEQPEFTPEGTQRGYAERYFIHEGQNPKQIAGDPSSDKIWLVDKNSNNFGNSTNNVCGEGKGNQHRALLAYDHAGHRLDCTEPDGAGRLFSGGGLGVSDSGLAYVSDREKHVIKVFELPEETLPSVSGESVSTITTETAKLKGEVGPGFEPTEYTFEYGTSPCSSNTCAKIESSEDVYGLEIVPIESAVDGLEPGTKYYYRVVATNSLGPVAGPERTFKTFPFVDLVNDPCANALARKQTRTAGLLDCRAYELASADFTGGYDVVSDLAPGQTPYQGYPGAEDKVLYSVRDGGIPGTGSPTNRGPDPYVATRGGEGWTTKYVGIPADGTPSTDPFGSPLADADNGLSAFAFGGSGLCAPCFPDGSSGIPVRMPDEELVQGMTGSMEQPTATPTGYVRNPMSADGNHLVFGSTLQFESAGNDETGDITIYDRNLSTNQTQVASTMPNGSTMADGSNVAELDISRDGSRIVIGQKLGTDGAGNSYYHLYMHIGNNTGSYDLTPGTSTGVLYAGMNEAGTRVFFSTKDQLPEPGTDTDESVDVYETEVTPAASVSTRLVSTKNGAASNDDSCSPPGVPDSWNSVSGPGKCNAVVLAGGAGVAGDGTTYFLSPELLAGGGKGEANQANLFVVRPSAEPEPDFVGTVDTSVGKAPPPLPKHPVVNEEFLSGLEFPESMAIDQVNGDLYVVELESGTVGRYTEEGTAHNFSAGPDAGTNKLTGQSLGFGGEAEVGVDNSESVFAGSVYISSTPSKVNIYADTGEPLGELTGFGEACGVAVDPSNGAVYVGDYAEGAVWRFAPTSGTTPVTNANYTKTGIHTEGFSPCTVGTDGSGHVYASGYGGGPLRTFPDSAFTEAYPSLAGTSVNASPSYGLSTDPENDDLYVSEIEQVAWLDSSGNVLDQFGEGVLYSLGVAINPTTKHVYASTVFGTVVEFGVEDQPYQPIDDPTVVHAVTDNEVHRWTDFQTTPDGDFALFNSRQPLTEGYDNAGFNMVYRYDANGKQVDCASCLATEGVPTSNASLPSYGQGITDDGTAFFNSNDQLVLRDTNGKKDAYQWEDGEISLISTGFSAFPSSLLSVSGDGTDAFFFTRETLVSNDHNGQAMKLYDARKGGGFFEIPESPPCAASDECHGPGTQAAPPPPIGTFKGTGGQAQTSKDCGSLSRRAKKNSNRAKNLRRKANKASGKRAQTLRHKASKAAKKARQLSKQAKSCRRSSGGNG
jgi:NHL repeat